MLTKSLTNLLIWQKVNKALPIQHLPAESENTKTKIGCEKCLRFFKKKLTRW